MDLGAVRCPAKEWDPNSMSADFEKNIADMTNSNCDNMCIYFNLGCTLKTIFENA